MKHFGHFALRSVQYFIELIEVVFPWRENYKELMLKFNDLQIQKDVIQQQVDSGALEKKVLQSHLMVCKLNQASKCCKLTKWPQMLHVMVYFIYLF